MDMKCLFGIDESEIDNKPLCVKLKYYRVKADLTQEQLSKLSGVSKATISFIEAGRIKRGKMYTIIKLCDALGLRVNQLHSLNTIK